jgi:hypothetical protein
MRQQLHPRGFVLQALANRFHVNGAALDDPDKTGALVFVRLLDDFMAQRSIPVNDLRDK